jgi:outer membrane lipoprotein-sorting protein
MKKVLVLLLAAVLPAAAEEAAQSPQAVEILRKADAAIKKVDSVRYHVKSVPEGVATRFRAPAEGVAVLSGWDEEMDAPRGFFAQVRTTMGESGEPFELTGGGDGETFFVLDHGTKKAYEDMDPGVLGGGARALRGVQVLEFVHDAPFDDELGAESITLEGERSVFGEVCHAIRVKYAGGQGESTWLFSKADFLPRGRIQHFTIPDAGEGKIETIISVLEVNVEVSPDLFRMHLPEGYERVDDFMP